MAANASPAGDGKEMFSMENIRSNGKIIHYVRTSVDNNFATHASIVHQTSAAASGCAIIPRIVLAFFANDSHLPCLLTRAGS